MKPYAPLLMVLLIVSTSFVGVSYRVEKSSSLSSDGITLYVGGSGPGNYSKIQDAIDNSSDGDTVFVYNGTYVENIVVDKSISLVGEDKDTTVIDGGGFDSTVEITSDYVSIEGFTVTNCKHDLSEAGIKILSNWNMVRNNYITKNEVAGIMLSGAMNNIIENNTLKDNIGYHIRLQSNSNDNTVRNNTLTQSDDWIKVIDCIWLSKSSNNLIDNNEITGVRDSIGISLYDKSNDNIVRENYIHDSMEADPEWALGIYIDGSEFNSILYNKIESNNFPAIYTFQPSNAIVGNDIMDNKQGFFLWNSVGYHNNIINNTIQARGSGPFDNGYPSCGNYWSDYDEQSEGASDKYKGPNQNIPGKDGIVDTPYNISGGNGQDRYPLIEPYGITKLTMHINKGLFKLSGFIKNIGDHTALNVQWSITIHGGIILGNRSISGTTKPLLSYETPAVFSNNFIGLGLIKITIIVSADNAPKVVKTIHGILLPFLLLLK